MLMDKDTQWLYQLLAEVQLEKFYTRIRDGLNITRIDHFNYVKDADFEYIGISKPAQRRLWEAVKRYKTSGRSRNKVSSNRSADAEHWAGGVPNMGVEAGTRALPSLIQDSELVLGERLGSGSFGVVRKGDWYTPTGNVLPVAVKSLKSDMSRQADTLKDFLQEVTVMQSLDHTNIIRLYGVVLTQPLKMVTELAIGGSLYDILRLRQYKYPLMRLWLFGAQIAAGMEYLESRRYIHRDLAARNVLLAAKELVKIGDFGLMRGLSQDKDHYVMASHRRIPFAWCAPESLRTGSFSHASDVWMYGVTLWEMFTFCEEPWCGLSGREILWHVERDTRLEKPPDCPQELFVMMKKCWAFNPADRPSFAQLTTMVAEAKPMEVHVTRDFVEPRKLQLAANDAVTVLQHSKELAEWLGQNQRTLNIGLFPAILAIPESTASNPPPSQAVTPAFISPPVKGSLQHTGHGDFQPENSWGSPARLEDGGWRPGPAREREPTNLKKMAGMSRSLESVLSGRPSRGQTPGAVRVDQHGRLLPPVMESNSMMMPRDPRRMSEASVNPPPPRPPLPNLKHLHIKAQKKPPMYPASATSWMPQFPAQKPAQTQPSQGAATGSNLIKMSPMNRSTSQLNEDSRERDRTREQEKLQSQNLVTQVMEAVHGVTIEEVQSALQRNDGNPLRAEKQLKLEQLYSLSLCSKEDCNKILTLHQWNLQHASRYLMRWSREDRAAASDRERQQISAERRV
uniref:Tyrosine kinase non receptor 1 n=1 Tax=Oryzias latipes TaxID=8090 RepID=A0A3P9KN01_ORYLA